MKILYKFTGTRKEKVEEKTTNEDGSITTKFVEKEIPVEVCLKQPSRRDREEISVVYNGEYGNALKKGLQTSDVMRRCLLDGGGIIAQKDLERADQIIKERIVVENEIQVAKMAGEDTTTLFNDLQVLADEFEQIEKPQREIYSKSAEAHAQNKTIEWCALNFSFFPKDKDYEYVFQGPTHEVKLNNYYDICDQDEPDKLILDIYDRATVAFHHHILANKTGQDYFDMIFGVSV